MVPMLSHSRLINKNNNICNVIQDMTKDIGLVIVIDNLKLQFLLFVLLTAFCTLAVSFILDIIFFNVKLSNKGLIL